jgi:SAM-dependent methyltransferase
MSGLLPIGAKVSPSTARNRHPILEVLKPRLPPRGLVLEIAAGFGEHAVYNAAAVPYLNWQPTDQDPESLDSIAAWRDHAALPNLLPPLQLDASNPASWPIGKADAVININMIHIAPWKATEGLMMGASRVLESGGLLFLYGPYIEPGVETAASNVSFNLSLKSHNPAWGLRRLDEVTAVAGRYSLELSERIVMPSNNLSLFFRKR